MFRSYLIAAGAALLCSTATAQQKLDPSRMYPITTPIKNAGTVDVTTGKWTKPAQQVKAGSQVIYNNTCSWMTQAYYAGFDWCEENYDEGRIPSPSQPSAPSGAQASNNVTSFQVSYCTYVGSTIPAGGYDMEVAFWDKMNGNCVGGIPPTPPPLAGSATAYFDLSGLGLPGSTGVGFQACWIVTLDTSNSGFVLASDGEGTFQGPANDADDNFIWSQGQNSTQAVQLAATPDGFFISAEPATGGFGACSYNIACGIDAITGATCGTGLDTFDASWINVDGIAVGAVGQPAGCVNTVAQYGYGTNCYFFGGYPSAPFASYWLVMESDGRSGATKYCTQTKLTSVSGCVPILDAPNMTLATGAWTATKIPLGAGTSVTVGIMIYTDGVGIGQSTFNPTSTNNTPFGALCLAGFKRSAPTCAAPVFSGTPSTCVGVLSLLVNCNAGALGVAVGEDVNVQCWYRDPPNPGTANFTNAIFYTVQ